MFIFNRLPHLVVNCGVEKENCDCETSMCNFAGNRGGKKIRTGRYVPLLQFVHLTTPTQPCRTVPNNGTFAIITATGSRKSLLRQATPRRSTLWPRPAANHTTELHALNSRTVEIKIKCKKNDRLYADGLYQKCFTTVFTRSPIKKTDPPVVVESNVKTASRRPRPPEAVGDKKVLFIGRVALSLRLCLVNSRFRHVQ